MAVVGLVLALVCSNLAIMLLLRGASQHREVSIRMAMGAGRGRILRQFLSESLVLSMAGGAVGCLAAVWLLRVVSATDLPAAAGLVTLSVDVTMLAFAIALSILTGVAFGLAPAVRALKTDAANVLAGASALRHHVALRYAMVSFQVALSIVLLTGTGLVIRSTMQMAQVDLGFNSAALALVTTNAAQAGYQASDSRLVYSELESRLTALPGVSPLCEPAAHPRTRSYQYAGYRGVSRQLNQHGRSAERGRNPWLFRRSWRSDAAWPDVQAAGRQQRAASGGRQ